MSSLFLRRDTRHEATWLMTKGSRSGMKRTDRSSLMREMWSARGNLRPYRRMYLLRRDTHTTNPGLERRAEAVVVIMVINMNVNMKVMMVGDLSSLRARALPRLAFISCKVSKISVQVQQVEQVQQV